jgi:hypothetical protein
MHPGEMNIDPIEAEFFSTEALGSLADALVREAIQNALDARLPESQLTIRFVFSRPTGAPQGKAAERYLAGLPAHLEASRSGLTEPPPPDEPLEFVVIEDYGTRGLKGDPNQSEDEEIETGVARNDFYYFWRNIGRSRKHASELGRWGLGKTVFPAASRINSFFAVTVPDDDRRALLMGQSVLKIHKLGDKRFAPYGYFGRFVGEFAVPVDDASYLDQFCRDFEIARGDRPGLSVVVPYPDPELTPETIVPSVIRHYFVPIIGGDLAVETVRDGASQRLDAQSLPRFLSRVSWEDGPRLRRLIDLARWGTSLPRDQYVRLQAPLESAAPRWTDDLLSAEALTELRGQFNAGRPIAATVPVWVKPAAAEPVLSEFDVYLERDDALGTAEEHFVRDGITIAGVRTSMPKGIRAIAAIRDRPLSALLGDSENPAHTEWQERSPKFKDRYRHGPFTLRYIKNAPREIVRVMIRPADGRDLELLQHLFSLDVPTEDALVDPTKGRNDQAGAAAETAWRISSRGRRRRDRDAATGGRPDRL